MHRGADQAMAGFAMPFVMESSLFARELREMVGDIQTVFSQRLFRAVLNHPISKCAFAEGLRSLVPAHIASHDRISACAKTESLADGRASARSRWMSS